MKRTSPLLLALSFAAMTAFAAAPEPAPAEAAFSVVHRAYDKLMQDNPAAARALLQEALRKEVYQQDGRGMSAMYVALADIDKFVAAGSPLPFDPEHVGAPGNKFEDVALGPSTAQAVDYLRAAEQQLRRAEKTPVTAEDDLQQSAMWFELASVYARIPAHDQLCGALNRSLAHHLEGVAKKPDMKIMMFGRVGTSEQFKAVIAFRKKGSKCE